MKTYRSALILLGLCSLSCSRVGEMLLVNATGAPVTVTLGSVTQLNTGSVRLPDSTWVDSDTTFTRFVVANADSIVLATGYEWDGVRLDDVTFQMLHVVGDGIEITARDGSIMSLFAEQKGDLYIRLRARRQSRGSSEHNQNDNS